MYDLGLTTEQFYRLTPRQFHRLQMRRKEDLAHREMVSAFTTAAAINSGFCRPEDPVSALDFMPNHSASKSTGEREMTDEELRAESEFNLRVLRERMKQQRDAENAKRTASPQR